MSHALLLRLFLSPSFFSVHVALQYLRTYADNIGITYYLTRRLGEHDIQELREVWGFICHLLVTRPSRSRALECFVVETAQKSTHIAMLTLWFMQAYIKDISLSRNPESFLICQRVLHECHEIIFADVPAQSAAPYQSLNILAPFRFSQKKVRPHVQPALVGIGMVWAGTPGMPQLTELIGQVAIEQGRVDEQGDDLRSVERTENNLVQGIKTSSLVETTDDIDDPDGSDQDEKSDANASEEPLSEQQAIDSVLRSTRFGSVSGRRAVAAQTSPALPLHLELKGLRRPRLSDDPFGQEDVPVASAFQSTPSFSAASRHPSRVNSVYAADILNQKYDTAAQMQLLRSHFCRTEIRFILALENISNKLLVVPKPARISALRAELTALNHLLPAEVCMPMWCLSSDTPSSPDNIPEPHHRIVRIPPGESVVLNSAERAPYLLLVEILHGDLDFDPSKRNNKEILKKIVLKENDQKGASKDMDSFSGAGNALRRQTTIPEPAHGSEVALGIEAVDPAEDSSMDGLSLTSSQRSPEAVPEEEEMDLVEQLYGSDSSLRGQELDLSESIVLPPQPKNRELDMATWSQSDSASATPNFDTGSFMADSSVNRIAPFAMRRTDLMSTTHQRQSSNHTTPRMLSLDEYSERMRTAAVMLAQLNASLVREPATTILPPGSVMSTPDSSSVLASPLRWFSGPSTPVQAVSLGGTPLQEPSASPAPSAPARMKLQPSEAAAIRERIMDEMLSLEEERMARMREHSAGEGVSGIGFNDGSMKTAEDEGIIRRELSKADPSAIVFSESWSTKKSRIRQSSPYGHLATWDCISVIVKTGGDLRQEQLAVQLIQEFEKIWKEESCSCWVRYFRILITGNSSGLVETITDAVSIHSIKKAEYARRLAVGRLGHVSLFDHFKATYGDPSSAKFVRAQRNFAKSLAGYSLVTYFLQIKDRHNGNILLDREGHLIHIDFGFMLSNSPGNIGFEAAPFKLPFEYLEVLGGVESPAFLEFSKLFREGFEAARKHCDRIITLVELMQKDSTLPCFAALGEQTVTQLRDRFQQGLTQAAVADHVQRLIDSSLGSTWTRLYDSYQYYSQSIL